MMTRDEIKSLAMESIDSTEELLFGNVMTWDEFGIVMTWDEIERFAYLIADAEREKCAKICDAAQLFGNSDERWSAKCCSEAIRARGQI
mgnify:CR=1 FL=1